MKNISHKISHIYHIETKRKFINTMFSRHQKGYNHMAFTVTQRVISSEDTIYSYCDNLCRKAKLLYNAALFRVRNVFTGYEKEHRTENEIGVFEEIAMLQKAYPTIHVRKVISYYHLEKLMRVTDNPDFFAGLPKQTAQQMTKQAVTDFKNWLASLREYKKHPEKYLGKPRMPHYKKQDLATVIITNQDAVLYPEQNGVSLKLPITKERLYFSNISEDAFLKDVKIKPYHGRFLLCLTFEEPEPVIKTSMPNTCAIDFGTDNFAAIVCDDGSSAIYKGGAVLSDTQWFHKQKAKYVSILTRGHKNRYIPSKRLSDLSYRHANFVKDQCHKISRSIIDFCVEHQAGTLILGVNPLWKQNSRIGRVNNQKFVSMPITFLRTMITYKALNAGIKIVEQEESYTSKADITAKDYIPTYGVDDENAKFSGVRIKRGLYRCADGTILNADCHAAANIMRKTVPNIWDKTTDFSFLANPKVYGFHELNPKSIPVKGIAA